MHSYALKNAREEEKYMQGSGGQTRRKENACKTQM